ncbi:MAG: ATP-grasp domain-containing protein [Gemmatimonadaceae bacterium]
MPFVVFAAPQLSPNAMGMIEAAASLPDVHLGVITQEPAEKLPVHLVSRVAHWRVDDVLDTNQLIWAARELGVRYGPIHRLFGAYEQLQVPLAQARATLGVHGLSAAAATNFRDKSRMKDVLRANGVPCARHALVRSLPEAEAFGSSSGYPLVVKPPAGAGAQQTFRVANAEQLRAALGIVRPNAAQPVLLEEFIIGAEHSLESISIDGEAAWHSLTHYYPTPLHVLENPWIQWCVMLPREVDHPRYDDIKDAARRALKALGMTTGLSHMEWFRRRDGTVAISEVAARPPGAQITTLVSRAHDIDFVQAWIRLMVFNTFDVPSRKYAAGAAFLRGQGEGKVRAVHGWEQIARAFNEIITDVKLPEIGSERSPSYEGEGYILVRHPETAAVEQALSQIVSVMRVELG